MAESRNYQMQMIYRELNKKSKNGCKKPATTCDITTWVKDLMNAHITIVNILLFFFLNVGYKNGSSHDQLKKLFLNNIGRKGEKNWKEVTQFNCQKLYVRSEM